MGCNHAHNTTHTERRRRRHRHGVTHKQLKEYNVLSLSPPVPLFTLRSVLSNREERKETDIFTIRRTNMMGTRPPPPPRSLSNRATGISDINLSEMEMRYTQAQCVTLPLYFPALTRSAAAGNDNSEAAAAAKKREKIRAVKMCSVASNFSPIRI